MFRPLPGASRRLQAAANRVAASCVGVAPAAPLTEQVLAQFDLSADGLHRVDRRLALSHVVDHVERVDRVLGRGHHVVGGADRLQDLACCAGGLRGLAASVAATVATVRVAGVVVVAVAVVRLTVTELGQAQDQDDQQELSKSR